MPERKDVQTDSEIVVQNQLGLSVLRQMSEKKCFDDALSPSECEELTKFFEGLTSFTHIIVELLDKGIERAIQNFTIRKTGMSTDLASFLNNRVKAKSVLVDTLLTHQTLLPKAWGGVEGNDKNFKILDPEQAKEDEQDMESESPEEAADHAKQHDKKGKEVHAQDVVSESLVPGEAAEHLKQSETKKEANQTEKQTDKDDHKELTAPDVASSSLVPGEANEHERRPDPPKKEAKHDSNLCPDEQDLSFLPPSYSRK